MKYGVVLNSAHLQVRKFGVGNLRSKLALCIFTSSTMISSVTRTKHIFFSAFYLRANNRPAVSESSGISMSQTEEKVKEIYHIISHCIASQSKPVSLSEPPHRRKYNLKFDVSLSLAAYTKVRLPCIITCTFRRLRLPLPSVLRSPTVAKG